MLESIDVATRYSRSLVRSQARDTALPESKHNTRLPVRTECEQPACAWPSKRQYSIPGGGVEEMERALLGRAGEFKETRCCNRCLAFDEANSSRSDPCP